MPYRVEISANNRAGCKNKECKDQGIKIAKGEIRFGTLVTINEHQSWTWKHWGCVTPQQMGNLQEESGKDTDMVDGFDELPEEAQQKVRDALAAGHVADEDWRGDVEVNRPGMKGFRVKAKAPKEGKKGKKADQDNSDEEEEPKPKKKRGRTAADEDGAPAAKKAKGGKKATVKDEDDTEDAEAKPKKPKAKKAIAKNGEDDAREAEPKPKKPRAKKATTKANADEAEEKTEDAAPVKAKRGRKPAAQKPTVEEEGPVEAEAPKAKRGRKAATPADKEKPASQKRGRKRKAVTDDE